MTIMRGDGKTTKQLDALFSHGGGVFLVPTSEARDYVRRLLSDTMSAAVGKIRVEVARGPSDLDRILEGEGSRVIPDHDLGVSWSARDWRKATLRLKVHNVEVVDDGV